MLATTPLTMILSSLALLGVGSAPSEVPPAPLRLSGALAIFADKRTGSPTVSVADAVPMEVPESGLILQTPG